MVGRGTLSPNNLVIWLGDRLCLPKKSKLLRLWVMLPTRLSYLLSLSQTIMPPKATKSHQNNIPLHCHKCLDIQTQVEQSGAYHTWPDFRTSKRISNQNRMPPAELQLCVGLKTLSTATAKKPRPSTDLVTCPTPALNSTKSMSPTSFLRFLKHVATKTKKNIAKGNPANSGNALSNWPVNWHNTSD